MDITIFNKKIPTREQFCLLDNNTEFERIDKPFIYLFIQTNNQCQAKCPFCIYHSNNMMDFDLDKLCVILREISNTNEYRVRKLNFTGGEPLLNMSLFDKICNCVARNFNFRDGYTSITLNTNGINLWDVMDYNCLFDYIALSRHHYLDDNNMKIFGTKNVPSADTIIRFTEELERKYIMILRCNLITGQIDSYEEIKKYMDYFLNGDIHVFSFVTLMKNNEFCNTHQVDFNTLIKDKPELQKTRQLTRVEDGKYYCRCSNYVYQNDKGQLGTFYSRDFCNNYIKDSTLVYDGKYLRYGFGGEIIY
ncbi:MAG: radical SAM protein [Bacilli bacterium]|nr:radical SAM protein [Bacilli bacterium]